MLALNKSVIKVKESQIKGFKMIFELFRKVATSPESTPDSMTSSTIVTFNTDGKKLTDHLLATLKCCDKTIPVMGEKKILQFLNQIKSQETLVKFPISIY